MSLQIGRVGLETTFSDAVAQVTDSFDFESGRVVNFSGFVRLASLADSKHIRDQLVNLQGEVVPVVWSVDSSYDGFYYVQSTELQASAQVRSFSNNGLFSFSVTAVRLGSVADVRWANKTIFSVMNNSKGIIQSENIASYIQPGGSINFTSSETGWDNRQLRIDKNSDPSNPSATAAIVRYRSKSAATVRPIYTSYLIDDLANFYVGAPLLRINGRVMAGRNIPNDPINWELTNGLIHVTPNGSNQGRFNVNCFREQDASQIWMGVDQWRVKDKDDAWSTISVVRLDNNILTIRLDETLDLTIKRGNPILFGYLNETAAQDVEIVGGGTANLIIPSAASSATASQQTSGSNRASWVASATGTAQTGATRILSNGTDPLDFGISSEATTPGATYEAVNPSIWSLIYLTQYSESYSANRP